MVKTAARPVGRPSIYSDELAQAICERLAQGEPLARICDDEAMPDFSTVWRWDRDNAEFRKLSMRARELGTHFLADDCLRIADEEGKEPADKRVRIDTRLRLIGKWNAKTYGDKVRHVGGGADEPPIRIDMSNLTDEELEALEHIRGKLALPGGDQGGEGPAGG